MLMVFGDRFKVCVIALKYFLKLSLLGVVSI